MNSREIIRNLREKAPINPHEGLLIEAADKIEQLQQLIDDMISDHYVDTVDFYFARCQKLEEDFIKLSKILNFHINEIEKSVEEVIKEVDG